MAEPAGLSRAGAGGRRGGDAGVARVRAARRRRGGVRRGGLRRRLAAPELRLRAPHDRRARGRTRSSRSRCCSASGTRRACVLPSHRGRGHRALARWAGRGRRLARRGTPRSASRSPRTTLGAAALLQAHGYARARLVALRHRARRAPPAAPVLPRRLRAARLRAGPRRPRGLPGDRGRVLRVARPRPRPVRGLGGRDARPARIRARAHRAGGAGRGDRRRRRPGRRRDGGLWVDQLAVASRTVGAGLAHALLAHAFAPLVARGRGGRAWATDSRTGARGLYEQVGMHAKRTYRRVLQPAA